MESTGQLVEDSKDSSEELIDQAPLTANDETSSTTGRFYECMFCKRGFSTAQALGGHMNIHRRDRARISRQQQTPQAPSISNRPAGDIDQPAAAYPGFPPQRLQSHLAYQSTPTPATSTSSSQEARNSHGDTSVVRNPPPQQLSLFGEDLCIGLSARIHVDEEKDGKDDYKLDLELRLGPER